MIIIEQCILPFGEIFRSKYRHHPCVRTSSFSLEQIRSVHVLRIEEIAAACHHSPHHCRIISAQRNPSLQASLPGPGPRCPRLISSLPAGPLHGPGIEIVGLVRAHMLSLCCASGGTGRGPTSCYPPAIAVLQHAATGIALELGVVGSLSEQQVATMRRRTLFLGFLKRATPLFY